ncbi:hypothetical protein [Gordonia sp. N1V]|uniref:hypothetical protein n=1 Tax=Gordonia sp. N1V TaxID=3034163 RepID=UPI0023E15CA7|nr:hypothetical protein [Gordonia sp. N1V]MDF3280923.1 hypothetical protein [Gordonia sp. N1V]
MSGDYAYWESLFAGDATRIVKALYGSFLIRDFDAANTSLTDFSPFDPTTGNLRADLLVPVADGGQGWNDIGLIDENGVQFNPKYTTTDTMAWQNRMAQRTDVTLDQEECTVTAIQSTPLIDYINYQLPLDEVPAVGTVGYQLTKPNTPVLLQRQILAIGVDGATDNAEYFGTMYARALMIKPDKYDYQAKTEVQTPFTFDSYPDPYSGFAVRRFREGPAWRAAGGTTTWETSMAAPVATSEAGLKATIAFAPPASDNGPFTYQVTQTVGGTTTAVPAQNVTVKSSSSTQVVLEVSGLTAGAVTFRVTATGSNGSQSTPTASSNSITAAS